MPETLEIRVLGDFCVIRDGAEVSLPPSKKTRALLAYLAASDRPQRRERLCELFWDIPDDPRGALRWSLSKIRQILGEAFESCLEADRNTVCLRTDRIVFDLNQVRSLLRRDGEPADTADLEQAADLFRGGFLDDLALPRCPDFEAWREALKNEMEVLRLRLLRELIGRLRDAPERALAHAHTLRALVPDDPDIEAEIETLLRSARQSASERAPAVAPPTRPSAQPASAQPGAAAHAQEIRYCRTRDGARIAYSSAGAGPTLIKAAHWMSHLQYDLESPVWRHWIEALSAENHLIRYDERGNGLSDWTLRDLTFDTMVSDLESIIDAAGLDDFTLLGVSQGCAISIGYVVRHPERVRRLILYGGYTKGWRARGDPHEIRRREAMGTLIREGWGQDNPAFRNMFASLFIPGADATQTSWFNELQRRTVSPENAAILHEAFGAIDVSELLPLVSVPTLVLHSQDDAVCPYASGKALADGIRGARMVTLDSANHILLEHEPAFAEFVAAVKEFSSVDAGSTMIRGHDAASPEVKLATAVAGQIVPDASTLDETDADAGTALDGLAALIHAVVEEYGGRVVAFDDLSFTAVFGAPQAAEDHAYAACLATLEIAARIARSPGSASRFRAGLDTGEVVVDGGREADAAKVTGRPLRVAGRIARLLGREGIAATVRTRRAAGGYIRMNEISAPQEMGLAPGTRLYSVLAENKAVSRWHLREDTRLGRLVGRESELETLERAWQRAREGHGQIVGLMADAGVGKSRLAHEFLGRPAVRSFTLVEGGSLEFDTHVSFQAIKRLIRSLCVIPESATTETIRPALARKLAELGATPDIGPPLAALLDARSSDDGWSDIDAATRARHVQGAVRAILDLESQQRPIAILIEDLHWLDTESEGVLRRIADTLPGSRILVIATYRSEYRPSFAHRSWFQEIRLNPLSGQEAEDFLTDLLGTDPSVTHLRQLLVEHTDNTPLFLEESVRELAEMGVLTGPQGRYVAVEAVESLALPPTVHSVIGARLDRLSGNERHLLQVAAVIGKDVQAPLLAALAGLPPNDLQATLARLQDSEFLFEIPLRAEVVYTFKHAVTHDVAYATLTGERRRLLHERAFRAMERLYAGALEPHLEKLSDHALRAECWDKAANYLIEASDRAFERSAYSKSARFLEHAAHAVGKLEQSPESMAQAIDVRTRMRPTYDAIGAFDKAVTALAEARAIADSLGDRERLAQILTHTSYINSSHGRIDAALAAADELKGHAAAHGLPRYAAEADLAAAQALLMKSHAAPAAARLRPHYGDFTGPWRLDRFGQMGTRAVWFLGHLAHAEALLGNFKVAESCAREAAEIAATASRPIDRFAAEYFRVVTEIVRGPSDQLCHEIEDAVMECSASAAVAFQPWLMALLGHAYYATGQDEEAAEALDRALSEAEKRDLPQFSAYVRALAACVDARTDPLQAEERLSAASDLAQEGDDPWIHATTLRALAALPGKNSVIHAQHAKEVAETAELLPDAARAGLMLAGALSASDPKRASREAKAAAKRLAALGLDVEAEKARLPVMSAGPTSGKKMGRGQAAAL